MLGGVSALENSFRNVSSTKVGSRAKAYLLSDCCKLAVLKTGNTSRRWLGIQAANDRRSFLCSAIISTHPET